MKYISFATTSIPRPHLGIALGSEVLDVDLAAHALTIIGPDQMLDLIENYEKNKLVIKAILDKTAGRRFSDVRTFTAVGAVHNLGEVRLTAPIPRPRKNIMCLGHNYAEHARESNAARGVATKETASTAEPPMIFTKATTTANGPYSPIVIYPAVSEQIDWEAELGVVIGKVGKNVRAEEALNYVFGYIVLNDVSARDVQFRHKQFFLGKSLDGYCPMGPWIITADEVPDPQQLPIRLRVNGVTKQESNTSMMLVSVREIIALLSQGITLEPGDIIATGTPSGVGFARKPPEFLKAGDVLETEIAGIGLLKNSVVQV
jgi:2-keto-4-pentenoate hydratase/2-oxohepta-3-ene-1,7-dioic acid hydratase in catechol pathway